MTEFNNQSGLEFTDISSEEFRQYEFPCGRRLRIKEPLWLHVSEAGGHRVFDNTGVSHYIPGTWIHLFWKAKEGQPHFVK